MNTPERALRAVIFLACALILASCSTLSSSSPDAAGPLQETQPVSAVQKKLVEAAESFEGSNSDSLVSDGKTYSLDCSGGVMAVYHEAGIDLEKCYSEYEGNGVRRIYACLRDNKLILNTKMPKPGDLIFWDNTWDRNGDGKYNDYFTHVGMVVDVGTDGSIRYIHHNYRKGFIYEKMNLLKPDSTALNSPMRMRGSPPAPEGQYLSSHLVRVFGRAWMLPLAYWR